MENSPINLMSVDNSPLDLNLNEQSVIPEDIIPSTASENSLLGFLKDKEIRLWIFIFTGVLIVFLGVFFFMSKQTTEVKEKLADVEESVPDVERKLPAYFTASLFNEEAPGGGGSAPAASETPVSAETTADPLDGFNLSDLGIEDDATASDTVEPSIDTSGSTTTTTSVFDELGTTETEPTTSGDLLGSANTGEFGLESNTSAEVMMSGELEGDTGPALWLALIPTMFYGLARSRKNK